MVRRLLNPLRNLFINPNPIIHSLSMQGDINNQNSLRFDKLVEALQLLQDRLHRQDGVRAELDGLNYEVLHNLVLEVTRMSIEVKNMKMRVESLSSRLDFDERRSRALEGVVQYRPGGGPVPEALSRLSRRARQPESDQSAMAKGEALRSRRRRRRRGRQGGGGQQGQHAGGPFGPAPQRRTTRRRRSRTDRADRGDETRRVTTSQPSGASPSLRTGRPPRRRSAAGSADQ